MAKAKKAAAPAIDFARLFAVKDQLARQSAIEASVHEQASAEHVEEATMTAAPAPHALRSVPSGETVGQTVESEMGNLIVFPTPMPSPVAIASSIDGVAPDEDDVVAPVSAVAPSRLVNVVEEAVALVATLAQAAHVTDRREAEAAVLEPIAIEEEPVAKVAPTIPAPPPAVADEQPVVPVAAPTPAPAPFAMGQGTAALAPEAGAEMMLRVGMTRALHERLRAFAMLQGVSPTTLARTLLDSLAPQFPREEPMASLAKAAREAFPPTGTPHRTEVRMQIGVDAGLHRRLHQLAALRAQTLIASVTDLFESAVPAM